MITSTPTNTTPSQKKKTVSIIFFILGYAVALFLYYIDEGNYHFKGLANPAEWIFLSVYALFFMGCFHLLYRFLKKA